MLIAERFRCSVCVLVDKKSKNRRPFRNQGWHRPINRALRQGLSHTSSPSLKSSIHFEVTSLLPRHKVTAPAPACKGWSFLPQVKDFSPPFFPPIFSLKITLHFCLALAGWRVRLWRVRDKREETSIRNSSFYQAESGTNEAFPHFR